MNRRNVIIVHALRQYLLLLHKMANTPDMNDDQIAYFIEEIVITRNILHEYNLKANNILTNLRDDYEDCNFSDLPVDCDRHITLDGTYA